MTDRIDSLPAGKSGIKAKWLPVLVGSLLCILFSGLWRMLDLEENANLRNKVKAEAVFLSDQMETDLRNRFQTLHRMEKRWEIHRGTPKEEFFGDARLYLADVPGFQAIGWVDRNDRAQWVVSFEEAEKTLYPNPALIKNQQMAMAKAKKYRIPTITLPFSLIQGKGFMVIYPIYVKDQFDGYIVAVFRLQEWLNYIFNMKGKRLLGEFKMAVFFDQTLVYKQEGWDNLHKNEFPFTASVQIIDHYLRVRIRPTETFMKRNQTLLPDLIIMFGLLLSILVSFIVHLFQKSYWQARGEHQAKTALELEIQERQKIEHELQHALARIDMATEAGRMGIWIWDLAADKMTWNDRMLVLLEIPLDVTPSYEIWRNRIHPDDLEHVVSLLNKAIEGKGEFDTEYRLVLGSGVIRNIRAAAWVERDYQGKPQYLTGLNWDITEHREEQEALKKSEEQVRLLLNSTAEAIYGIDLNGNCTFANPACAKMLGYPDPQIFLGKNMHHFIHHSYADGSPMAENECKIYRAFREGKGEHVEEEVFWRADGICFPAEYWSYPQISNGKVSGAVVTFVDITERKRVEAALEKRIVALTQPINNPKDIPFEALFNMSDIQRLQDILAKTLGVAANITRPDGTSITQASNLSELCNRIIRKTPIGLENCNKSGAIAGGHNPSEPNIQPCFGAGLYHAGVSITVGGNHIANWVIGQVRDEAQSEEDILAYVREIGADPTEFLEAYRKIPAMTHEQFQRTARLFFEMANQLSTIAYQNIQQARFITERKRVEEFLRNSEARYRALVESQDDLISRYRPDTILTFVNDAYCQFYGKTWEELIGKSFLSMVAPEFQEAVRQEAESIVKEQKIIKGEYINYRKDGKECWIQWVIKGVLDENGKVFEIQAVGRDITRLKEIEEEIRKSEAKLKEAQHIARLGNWEADLINNTLHWSEGVYEIFEINSNEFEITFEAFLSAIHPDDREMVQQAYTDSLKNKTPYHISHRLLMKDGRIKWVNEICRIDYDSQGHPLKSWGVVQDVTEQKQAEEALRDSQQKFQGLVETLYDWVWEVDSQGQFTYVSPQIKNILGYEPQEIIGKTPFDLMPAEEKKRVSSEFSRLLKDRKPIVAFEIINIHKDGRRVIFETNGLPFYDADGNFKGYRGTDHDITERKQVEEMIRHMATHDGLTDLPDLRLARERLSMAVNKARGKKSAIAVMFIDLDGFKEINDTYGHDVGDGVLIEVAKRLSASLRDTDTVARIGGDEFLLVINYMKTPEDAAIIATKVNQVVSQPIILSGLQVSVCASIGIALFPRDNDDADRLIKLADEAMYKVKASGKNGYKFASKV